MYRLNPEDHPRPGIHGVLNDFDLVSDENKLPGPHASMQRTGTRPFLANDLLRDTPVRHLYRHDLESFLHVLRWIGSRFNGPDREDTTVLKRWLTCEKEDLIGNRIVVDQLAFTPHYRSLVSTYMALNSIFSQGQMKMSLLAGEFATDSEEYQAQNRTLCDSVTFESFMAALEGGGSSDGTV